MPTNGQHGPSDAFHIQGDNGMTLCGLNAREVYIGGPFISPMCGDCERLLMSTHPLYEAEDDTTD
jgi:hypothetical protein